MTYGEIYDEICQHCWPGVIPPANMPAIVRQKIKSAHRMVNRDYNFWFTLSLYQVDTVPDQRTYQLPISPASNMEYKKIERAYFTVYLQNYCHPPLQEIGLTDHLDTGLNLSSNSTEYPDRFRVDGFNIDLYPLPSEVRTLNVLCWRFLPQLDITQATLATLFTPYVDDISRYCSDALIYYVVSVIKLMQDEWQSSASYKQLFIEAIEGSMQEDVARRAMPENKAE